MKELFLAQQKVLSKLYGDCIEARAKHNIARSDYGAYWKPLAKKVMEDYNKQIEEDTPWSCRVKYYNQYYFFEDGLELINDDECGRPAMSIVVKWEELDKYSDLLEYKEKLR